MKDLQTNRSDKTVYIRADARARFAGVTDVIDNLRTAGVDQLGLITETIQERRKLVSKRDHLKKGKIAMAMAVGGSRRTKADINVTPLIDVLLVL